MKIKEHDCGSWGWYFDNDEKLSVNSKEFLEQLILISFKFGVNLPSFGIVDDYACYHEAHSITERIFDFVDSFGGNKLQKAINRSFYSEELSSRMLRSIIYSKKSESSEQHIYCDADSVLFGTLKEDNFHSFFYNLRSNVFIQEVDDYVYGNTSRFNSYIRCIHQLMSDFNCSIFDYSILELTPFFNVSEEGYLLYKKDCVFYEDIYDLLPEDMKYKLFREVSL